MASFLLLGYRGWPAFLLVAISINWFSTRLIVPSVLVGAGSIIEALVGAYFVKRFAGGPEVFNKPINILKFSIVLALISPISSLAIAVFRADRSLMGQGFPSIWMTWFASVCGIALVTPVAVLWFQNGFAAWSPQRRREAVAALASMVTVGIMVFGLLFPTSIPSSALAFLCIPFLMWITIRFSQLEAAMAVLLLGAIALYGTVYGYGSSVSGDPGRTLMFVQAFMSVTSLMTISVAAVLAERKNLVEQLREARQESEQRATSDPLTGLANYRRFVDAFNAEEERAQRTEQPFSLVLFDLDGLKAINDLHGHLVGSRALCRVGDMLRVHSRAIDTAVRYGGDEFALILPGANAEQAQVVAERIQRRVANDGGSPPISLCFGIAVFPDDGRELESIFRKADTALYQMKNSSGTRSVPFEIDSC